MREILINTYLDYRNNYLTIELFAEHNLLTVDQAKTLINLGLNVMNTDIEKVL